MAHHHQHCREERGNFGRFNLISGIILRQIMTHAKKRNSPAMMMRRDKAQSIGVRKKLSWRHFFIANFGVLSIEVG